jgi:hypothetical protein
MTCPASRTTQMINRLTQQLAAVRGQQTRPQESTVARAFLCTVYEGTKTSFCDGTRMFETHISTALLQCEEEGDSVILLEEPGREVPA